LPSKPIGKLVEAGAWNALREQVLADVLSAMVIAVQHLASHGEISGHPQLTLTAVAQAASAEPPDSKLARNAFAPWVRWQHAASRLRGVVYRAS
jgi:hypothetical protein